jgi:hypothetical protein
MGKCISAILNDFRMAVYRKIRTWTNENNRPLLCELLDGVAGKIYLVFF